MHIQLLPAARPPERSLSSDVPRVEFAAGQRVMATVLGADAHGRPRLAFAEGEAASRTPLSFPPGTRLLLEVLESATDEPHLRVVDVPRGETPAVSALSYGYAAAVLAARTAGTALQASAALLQWVPLLMSRGIVTPAQAAALWRDLAPVGAPPLSLDADGLFPAGHRALGVPSLADALATRLGRDPALLEARMAWALRQGRDVGALTAGADLRARLAQLARALETVADDESLAGARSAVERLQASWLADQARTAAHFARDGMLDVRTALCLGADDIDLHLKVGTPPDDGHEGPPGMQRVRLDLTLAGLGRVQVQLDASARQLRVELVTERATAADAIDAGLGGLTKALGASGYGDVFTRVSIDPVRIATSDPALDLPPEGSIVNTEA